MHADTAEPAGAGVSAASGSVAPAWGSLPLFLGSALPQPGGTDGIPEPEPGTTDTLPAHETWQGPQYSVPHRLSEGAAAAGQVHSGIRAALSELTQ